MTNVIFAISEGCKLINPKSNHLCAPIPVEPKNSTRTKSPKFKPLEITENFRWKRGYRDLIIDVINKKFNQYNKSSASLQVLLKNRPDRTQWQKDDFITNVIDIDTMMRTLRANKQSFADNENIFEKMMEVCKDCSLGQITSALFEVGGQYRRNM